MSGDETPKDPAPFVRRTFEIGADQTVDLLIFQPKPDQNDWRCDLQLHWPTGPKTSYAMGVDPMQALLLAIDQAHVHLLHFSRESGAELRWLDDSSLGLPDGPGSLRYKTP